MNIEAYSFEWYFNDGDLKMNKEPYKMRECTSSDLENGFTLNTLQTELIKASPHLRCFEDPSSVTFSGSFKTEKARALIIEVTSCKGQECLSEQEINDYIEVHGLAIVMN